MLKKFISILVVSIFFACFFSCKNDTKTTVSGLVVDAVTGNPIANAKVFLGKLESGTYGISASSVDETTSDASGRYSFEFDAAKREDYAIIAKADRYFETESVSDNQLQEGKKNDSFNITLKPKAVIKIHVKKTDMSYDSLDFGCNLKLSGTSKFVFGRQVDTNLIYDYLKGGNNIYVYIYVQKYIAQSLIYSNYDSLNTYLIPVDTTYINLNY